MSALSLTLSSPVHLSAVQAELHRVLSARQEQAVAYGAHYARLWRVAADCMFGGKFLRPQLLLGAIHALLSERERCSNSASEPEVISIAAAIEMLHYAFLLHDDVIDGDLRRRGNLNLIGAVREECVAGARSEEAALHWGQSSAILMGNALLTAAHSSFASVAASPDQRDRLLSLFEHTVTESIVGEYLDVGLSNGVVPSELNTILSMSRLKTATYTFELPFRAAVILCGAPEKLEHIVGSLARHLGVAFQLQDDLLSTFGDAEQHGKDAFSDLREGKETAIIAYARMTSAWPSIEPRFGTRNLSLYDAQGIRDLLRDCGAERFMRSLIDEQLQVCFDLLAQPEHDVPPALMKFVGDLVATLEERQS